MKLHFLVLPALMCLSLTVPAHAVLVAGFNFEDDEVNGNTITNLGVGPDGTLMEGAIVEGGVLKVEGLGQGLDIPLGALNPFGGDADWSVQFDVKVDTDLTGGGPLFSSDGSICDPECNGEEEIEDSQGGSLNIFVTDEGEVVADAWYIGAIGGFGPDETPINDGEFHTIRLDYLAADGLWELYVDDLDEPAAEEAFPYLRDATLDRTLIGHQTNPDFGFEDIDPPGEGGESDGITAEFDNFRIDAPSPPPAIITINRETGEMVLESIAAEDFNFTSLSIESASGSLSPEQWFSISGNLDGSGDGSISDSDWTIDSQIAELLSESGEGTLEPGQTFSLGEGLWLPSAIEDIRVELYDPDLDEAVRSAIAYEGEDVAFADLDMDGELTVLDWEKFVEGYGSDLEGLSGRDAYFLADLNVDGVHDAQDFIEFREAFDAANGDGAFEELVAVPEPAGIFLILCGAIGCLSLRRSRSCLRGGFLALMVATCAPLFVTENASAELLVEYTFTDGATDSSGNGRDGDLDPGDGDPEISGGVLNMTGGFEEGLIIPLGDANPFDGSKDFTIDVSFLAIPIGDESGQLLISSADFNEPTNGDNHSMAVFIDGGGEIVYDNFFVGEVRIVPDESVLDEAQHQLRVTYSAPEEVDEPGTMFMRLDGVWLPPENGEIQPAVPNIGDHEVRLGGSLNDEFPFECEGFECAVREFNGELDDVRIFDEAFPPTLFTAEVNRANGDITLKGGQLAREVAFYELTSEENALNGAAWADGNLDQQNVDAIGEESGDTWDTLDASSERVAEAFLKSGTVFEDGTEFTLPGAWAGGAEDLELTFTTTDLEILTAEVTYVGEGTGNPGDCNPNTMGDLDGNGTVEFADFLVLSANYGNEVPSHEEGDIDCNGIVEFADFLVLSANFGTMVGGAQSVPEPAGWLGLLPALLIGLSFRKRH